MDNSIWIVGIICFTVYQLVALRWRPTRRNRYEELKTLFELCEKGVITKDEFEEKKREIWDAAED